jgi:hypothetical protein
MKSKKGLFFLAFLIALSVGGAALVYQATSRIGPGVAADGTIYLSVAANLLKGRGFIDLYGNALTSYPPLYPVLIASVSWLTRADIFFVGWYINIITFGLTIFFSGILFQKTYPDRMLFAYIGSIFIATSLAVIDTCASILSDSLFLLAIVLFLLAAKSFTETQKSMDLIWMGLLACLASLERYAGLFLVLTGVIFLIRFYWKNYGQALFKSALFLISALPIFLWGILHNYPVSGWQFLNYGPAGMTVTLHMANSAVVLHMANFTGNFYWTIAKILSWFFPFNIIKIVTPVGLLIAILLILILLNRPPVWNRWFQRLISRAGFANTILLLIYLGILIFYTDYYATNGLGFQRYHIILIPPLLIVLFAVYEELIPPRLGISTTKIKDGILVTVFILWLIYPFSEFQTYEREAQINGEIANNSFNYVNIRESDFLKMAENLSVSQQIYSNYEPAAWFYLRRNILSIPRVDPKSKQFNSDSLIKFRNLISSSGGGYLVWFKTINYRDNLPSLNQLNQTIKMEPVFTSDIGDIYHIVSDAP